MFLPFKSQVYLPWLARSQPAAELSRELAFYLPDNPGTPDVAQMLRNRLAQNRLMQRFCEERGIPFRRYDRRVDGGFAAGENVYFPDESHLNERGQAIVAACPRRVPGAGRAAFHVKLPALTSELPPSCDVAIVGAGAAGLATAIFARRFNRSRSVAAARRRAGAGREDPGQRRIALQRHERHRHRARLLGRQAVGRSGACCARFRSSDTIAFFREIGVTLHEEAGGKLFPDTNRARDVLDALLRESAAASALTAPSWLAQPGTLERGPAEPDTTGTRPGSASSPSAARCWRPPSSSRPADRRCRRAAATAPASRSPDVSGHTIVPTTPALAPLLLDPADAMHARLSGVSHDVELAVWIDGAVAIRLTGSLLWTHFGISGPVALNASRHWLRAQLDRPAGRDDAELPARHALRRRRRGLAAAGRRQSRRRRCSTRSRRCCRRRWPPRFSAPARDRRHAPRSRTCARDDRRRLSRAPWSSFRSP